ncbi:hypothetical protein LXA43DRAFT_1098421 [Ganoderma leucocontextum]|nr:hypothetical protein LXA43DRAFT_1098421 [Ganoderma leucocontextum]
MCSARYYTSSRHGGAKQLKPPRTYIELDPTTPFIRPCGARKLSTSNNSGQEENTDGTIRDLPVNAFSPEDSRWTTEYDKPSLPVPDIEIVSWNVDFMAVDAADRVFCILDHLKTVILTNDSQPAMILLQELKEESFKTVLANRWVREHFVIVPPNTGYWPGRYGLATLVSRHIRIEKAQMLQFRQTTMGRTAIFVDVSLRTADANAKGGEKSASIRIANTHLDMLRQPGIDAGIVGGDMNMILPADQRIHVAAGLHDAGTDGPEANTWGYQSKRRSYQAKRMDRVFYTPAPGLVVEPVEVVGKGLKTERGQWVSDHYALQTTIALRHEEDSDS